VLPTSNVRGMDAAVFHVLWSRSPKGLIHRVSEKTGPFVISSYLCFASDELHENFQKYTGDVACCEYRINVTDYSLLISLQRND